MYAKNLSSLGCIRCFIKENNTFAQKSLFSTSFECDWSFSPFSLLAIVRPMPLSLTLFLLSLSSFSNSLDVIQSFCSSSLVISALVSSPSLSSVLKGSTASVFHLSLASLSESFLTKMDCKSQLYRK